ncbi:hypothetical protein AAFN60_11300 [Roseibacillus persicicus]|uniref:Uncharacterized protein n=1 Tax=Roseibacillus persicicus TaxID=454148 RepID=A0A918TD39_9BACT|nr:hypothetical protein [Roseibacillus persicicus]GHC40154.1 hypothetical protein GCM10007100_00610 [Roseibacillus persicicus]
MKLVKNTSVPSALGWVDWLSEEKLILWHGDLCGFTVLDSVGFTEDWTFHESGVLLDRHIKVDGDRFVYADEGVLGVCDFKKKSCERFSCLEEFDFLVHVVDNVAILDGEDGVAVVVELDTGKTQRFSGANVICPCKGYGSKIIGYCETSDGEYPHYLWDFEKDGVFTLTDDQKKISLPSSWQDIRVWLLGEAGFAMFDAEGVSVYFFDWEGQFVGEITLGGDLDDSFQLFAVVPWRAEGELGAIIVAVDGVDRKQQLFTVKSMRIPKVEVNVTVNRLYIPEGGYGICGAKLIWVGESENGGKICSLDLQDGTKTVIFEGEPIFWLTCSQDGVFFGDRSHGDGDVSFLAIT